MKRLINPVTVILCAIIGLLCTYIWILLDEIYVPQYIHYIGLIANYVLVFFGAFIGLYGVLILIEDVFKDFRRRK